MAWINVLVVGLFIKHVHHRCPTVHEAFNKHFPFETN